MRPALIILPMIAMLSGCGGASVPPPATHDDFRAIQRHEAEIADARGVVDDPDARCEARRDAARDGRAAAGSICRIADDTTDLDAVDRCERGRDAARELEASVDGRCPRDGHD